MDRSILTRKQRVEFGYKGEYLAEKLLKGRRTWHREVFDVVVSKDRLAVEVKTIHVDAKDKKICMHSEAVKEKKAFCKKWGCKAVMLMIVMDDDGTAKVYRRDGIGGYRMENMEYVGSFKAASTVPRRAAVELEKIFC